MLQSIIFFKGLAVVEYKLTNIADLPTDTKTNTVHTYIHIQRYSQIYINIHETQRETVWHRHLHILYKIFNLLLELWYGHQGMNTV